MTAHMPTARLGTPANLTYFMIACVSACMAATSALAQDGTLLVVNRHADAGSVSFFDLQTESEIARVPIGPGWPHEVAVSPDGRLALTAEYGRETPGERLGVFSVPGPLQESFLTWVPATLVAGAIFFGLARLGAAAPALMPGIVGTLICADFLVQIATGPYPGARPGGVLAVIVLGTLVVGWMREMHTAPRISRQRQAG